MIEVLINNVDSLILSFVQGAFGSLTPIIGVLWRLMFIVFIAVFGYKAIVSGRFSAPDLIVNSIKIIVLLLIATEWDTFFLLVYNMTTDLPSDVAGQIMAGAASTFSDPAASDQTTANQALSGFYDRSMEVSESLLEAAGWSDLGLYLYAFSVWIGAIAFTGFAAMLIILAKLAVGILLAIGPLFILLLIFANTRNLFEGWLRTLLNYAVIPIFVYALLALLLTLAESPLQFMEDNSSPNNELLTALGPFLFVAFVSVLLLAQVMNIAASITGGLSLSTLGAGAWVSRAGNRVIRRAPAPMAKSGIWLANAGRYPKQTYQATRARVGQAIKNIRGF